MDIPIPFLITIEINGDELLRQAARLQLTARKYGFRPVWLVGPGALRHPLALETLARWQKDGDIELGGWLNAGTVPPIVDLGQDREWPALTDFPESVMDEKLAWFTSVLAEVAGRQPVSLRSARAAVDDRYYSLLAKHGYKVDLTVVPHAKIDESDFTGYSEKPYLTPQGVLEVPRTVRRRKHSPFVEDLILLPGPLGSFARTLFPTLRCFRLRRGNRGDCRVIASEAVKSPPEHLDLRISSHDWKRGDALVRDLERILVMVQTSVVPMTAEEFYQRFRNEQLRKGLT